MTQATTKPRVHYVRWTLLALAMVALAVGMVWMRWRGLPYGVARSLGTADQYELISLNPHEENGDYYLHAILGRTTISDPQTRLRINAALQAGVRQNKSGMAICFYPRHAIRVTSGGVVTDVVICFQCDQIQVFRNGQRIETFAVDDSPEPVFDDVLTNAGVPLAPKSH